MKKIEKLTPEQEAKVPIYLKKWLDNGRSIERIDRKKTIEAVKTIYRCCKEEEPKYFFFFPSPIQCQLAVNILKNSDLEIKKLLENEVNLWDQSRDQSQGQSQK